MLKVLGGIVMVLSVVATFTVFMTTEPLFVVSSAFSGFIGGAALYGLGSIQEDVAALRERLAPVITAPAVRTAQTNDSIAAAVAPPTDPSAEPPELRELRGQLKRGAISHGEFERKKAQILST